jgi:ubiquinone/menaquinone biosynthesis C-methylase UbiE
MDTVGFNFVDKMLANWRFGMVEKYIMDKSVVLDLGCGQEAKLLRKIAPRIKLGIGLDYEVENRKIGNIKLINDRLDGKIPIKSESVDTIVMTAVLEHIETIKVDKLMNELKRILKKKGKIVMTTPTPQSRLVLETLARFGIVSGAEIFDHKKYYGKKDMEKLASLYKFKINDYRLFQMGLNSFYALEKN